MLSYLEFFDEYTLEVWSQNKMITQTFSILKVCLNLKKIKNIREKYYYKIYI